jgi:hypothetical protein
MSRLEVDLFTPSPPLERGEGHPERKRRIWTTRGKRDSSATPQNDKPCFA